MISAHGTKSVRLQRKKSGLDFSVKGGKEHGIPIVVSWIKENGAAGNLLPISSMQNKWVDGPSRLAILYPFFYAASHLRLGDEILAVNGHPLQDLAHAQAVQKLRGAGPTVILRVKPNQTLEGRTIDNFPLYYLW